MRYLITRLRYITSTLKYKLSRNVTVNGWCDYLSAEINISDNARLEIGKMSSADQEQKSTLETVVIWLLEMELHLIIIV